MAYRVDIDTIYDDLIALFRANLTTLNQDLTNTFTDGTKQIVDGVPRVVGDALHPIIFIYQGDKTESNNGKGTGMGNGCRRRVIQTIFIRATSKVFAEDGNIDNKDARNLMANIDELLRNNPQFSAQVLDCNPSSTNLLYSDKYVYINSFETTLDVDIDIRG